MTARRQTFVVRFTLGGTRLQKKVIAVTSWGAILVIKALYQTRPEPLTFLSSVPTGRYYGPPIEPDPDILGDF